MKPSFVLIALLGFASPALRAGEPAVSGAGLNDTYVKQIQPLLKKYCFECHAKKAQKGDLDLERFNSLDAIRKDIRPWQHLIEQVEVGEMPPKNKSQPSIEERKTLLAWVRTMLDAEARARVGDPGRVPVRRLSNSEYDNTIRDLTGVDLKPTREFPADGAAGEGFTNAAEALSDITPPLFTRYLDAAKEIADHAVLLPDGIRFSAGKTRRDWSDESLARLRKFYAEHTTDGRHPVLPYLSATVRHREALTTGAITLDAVAAKEKLNAKYLGVLWQSLNDKTPSKLLDSIRARWREAGEPEIAFLASDIAAWQTALWTFVPVGSYRYGNVSRQVANDPVAAAMQPLKVAVKVAPGQSEVVLYLAARDLAAADGPVVWHRPRFEATGKTPLLLKDYEQFGGAYEIDRALVFANTGSYLFLVHALAHNASLTADDLAQKNGLDPAFLKAWATFLAIEPVKNAPADPLANATAEPPLATSIPALALDLLDQKTAPNAAKPWLNGWRSKNGELPLIASNSSDSVQLIPGKVRPHKVVVHPLPNEFVGVVWKSPLAGKVNVSASIAHAHSACGNGVAWWLEQRRGEKAYLLADGLIDLGGDVSVPGMTVVVEPGDRFVLAIDARNGNHNCDLTEINLAVTDPAKAGKTWDLSVDIADSIHDGNPHADVHGNKDTWSFIRGAGKFPGKSVAKASGGVAIAPPSSLLARWRAMAANPDPIVAGGFAEQIQKLLTGPRPVKADDPDRVVFDLLTSPESPVLKGVDLAKLAKTSPQNLKYGLPKARFGNGAGTPDLDASLIAPAGSVVEIRLPAALFRDRELAVEGKLEGPIGDRVVLFQATTTPPDRDLRWHGKSGLVATSSSPAYKDILAGYADFRRAFPWNLCFPNVVPTDETVSLKMFHREDEPLARLFLNEDQKRRLDHLWNEHRFISQQAVVENNYLPQFIGYVTQDQPKALLDYFQGQRPAFQKRADDFEKDALAAEPKHRAALEDFASRAFRRPLAVKEKTDLLGFYDNLRKKGVAHDEAVRGTLTRVLVSPAFLFRIENAPAGKKAGPIDDWELATRLSYFLWSSAPNDELRRLAAAGKLRDSKTLAEQTQRMIKDDRLRSLAIDFGTQWIHVREFDTLKEKNDKLFPTFTPALRKVIYEESILFFQDLFQNDRPISHILDADATYLNETLAKHYGIPNVAGPQWRRVEGVRKFGRGGILGLASVHAKQSGASRTSPVLRGNWVVETLLGEKLPRPPADVPILPDDADSADQLTTRQQVEKHVSVASCAACHVRIDPFGFAFENFDPIGRWRVKEISGLPVDARAKLRDGAEFDGIDGLRAYLLTKKKEVITRLFCQRLLGYALGRATTLSDSSLIDEMLAELNRNDGRISAAVLTIVRSPQFRMIRGSEFED